jgi:hypothetical protein
MGVVGLALAGLWYFAGGSQQQATSSASEPPSRVAAPLTHENLSVYFIHGEDTVRNAKVLTLQEALEREVAVVHETSNVNMLAVENRSPEYELFIQSGDIVKGGKQDRMAATDVLLPPSSGVVPLPAHCVEQGRWTRRGAEDSGQFKTSAQCAAGKDLKYANAIGQQAAVWQNVSANQTKLNENLKTNANAAASPTSFQLTLEDPVVKTRVAQYEVALKAAGEERDNIIGVVFVVNGQVTGAEVYGSNALFRKAWPKLLNAAAVEAAWECTDKVTAAPPSTREVECFLTRSAEPEPAETTNLDAQALARALALAQERYRLVSATQANAIGSQAELRELERLVQELQRALPQRGSELQAAGRDGVPGRPNDRQQLVNVRVPGVAPDVTTVTRAITVTQRAPTGAQPAPNPSDGNLLHGDSAQSNEGRSLSGQQAMTRNRGAQPVTGTPVGGVAPGQPAANPDGNRLNSNRTENNSTLLVESLDPARQNAVIHRSYLKK